MGKVLFGRESILKYLGVTKNVFYQLKKQGMPVKKGAGGWTTHTDLLDEYFKNDILQSKKTA